MQNCERYRDLQIDSVYQWAEDHQIAYQNYLPDRNGIYSYINY